MNQTHIFVILTLIIYLTVVICLPSVEKDLLIAVLTNDNTYDAERIKAFIKHIDQQKEIKVDVIQANKHWEFSWSLFPIIKGFSLRYRETKWLLICGVETRINLKKLLINLKQYNNTQPYYLGRASRDSEPSIIHHFGSIDDKRIFLYGDTDSGIVLSSTLSEILGKALTTLVTDFAIDAKHELAMFIRSQGHYLTSVDFLCSRSKDIACATSMKILGNNCGVLHQDDLYVAIKTAKIFHENRIPILMATWGRDPEHMDLFSDHADPSIPTIDKGVNTKTGHCGKMFSIFEHSLQHHLSRKWLLIADDDTLLSVRRLRNMLSCFDASVSMAIGERYGYSMNAPYGYEYPTGGSGMILSMRAVQRIVNSGQCRCGRPDNPDDMHLGACLKRLAIPITHSPAFHQAQHSQYSEAYKTDHLAISYHKHTNTDPLNIYERYLNKRSEEVERNEEPHWEL